jgi:anti-sigma factor RsiW
LTYEAWIEGVKAGRSYCGDGLSHLFDFKLNGLGVGEVAKENAKPSRVSVGKAGTVRVTCDAAALLAEKPTAQTEAIRAKRLDEQPYWHLERSRIGETRTVPVELIVNGKSVQTRTIPADGSVQNVTFEVDLKQSSWVALRILPSCHTNPIFVEVDNKPIRASRKSAEWCAKAVDVCWNSKVNQIREAERGAAKAAYDQARELYTKIAAESMDD